MNARTPLLLLTFSIAAVGIQALMLSPLLTDIARGLATGAKEVGFAAAGYGAGVATAALLAAPQLGRWPKRTAIRLCFAILAAALLACGLAVNWQMLVVAQFVAGLASGVIIPATYALSGDIAAPEARAHAMGRVLFGWSVAMVGGVPLAALLSGVAGWRGTFMIVAAIALAMAAAGALLPRTASTSSADPVRYAAVFRIPGATVGYLATFAYMIGFYQTYTFIGDHVRHLHGAGAWLGGTISLSYGIGFGVAVAFDRWIDRKGPRTVMPLGLFLVGLNYAVLPFAAGSLPGIMIYPFLWGMVNHFCMTALVAHLGSLSSAMRGTIMGLFSFTTYFALGTAGAIYGPIYDHHGFFATSFAAAATLFLAMGLAWWTRPAPPPSPSHGTP